MVIGDWVMGISDLAVVGGFRSAFAAFGCGLPVVVVCVGALDVGLFGSVFVGLGFRLFSFWFVGMDLAVGVVVLLLFDFRWWWWLMCRTVVA